MTKKIMIDAGHGGKDPGAAGNGLQEKDITLTLSKYMQDYLEENYTGHEVKLTRTTDIFHELSKRADIANDFGADVFISNHVNAGGGTGFESFVYDKPSKASIALQNGLNTEAVAVAKKYGLGAHGIDKKRKNLAVVRETKMPAILTEICFIDSKDASLLK
jgi:N-acetylmuramoyl-L-alanine amidase